MTAPVDFAGAKAVLLSSVVGQSIKLARNGREWVGLCPFHEEKSPSFTVNDEKGFYHCFGCGGHGDAADFIAAIAGCGLREAVARLGVGDLPQVDVVPVEKSSDTIDAARRIWREAVAIEGTPAEAYLRRRGIHIALPGTLRFARLRHPEGGTHPAMVALVTTPENKVGGIQRTFLDEQGRKARVRSVKLSLGRVAGGAIRLAPKAAELVVCEGGEDDLTLVQELGRAVWVAAGASMLPSMRFPAGIESIVIGRDNDAAGEREADKAARAFTECGLRVRIMAPDAPHKDFNSQLCAGNALGELA